MSQVITAAVWITIFTNAALAMAITAESATDQTLDFTANINNALPCAFAGVDLLECSPNLYDNDFETELEQYQKELYELQALAQNEGLVE